MKWLRNMAEKYERWRAKTEMGLVKEVLEIQIKAHMKENGILVVEKEEEAGCDNWIVGSPRKRVGSGKGLGSSSLSPAARTGE